MAQVKARIYKPSKSAMQSGKARTQEWLLEYVPAAKAAPDPLMGWAGSADTRRQVQLRFETREAAVAFAQSKGLSFDVEEPAVRSLKLQSYADNFR